MINMANVHWTATDAVAPATYVLWRLNGSRPFINGHSRTARAASHFVLGMKPGGRLRGRRFCLNAFAGNEWGMPLHGKKRIQKPRRERIISWHRDTNFYPIS